MTIFKKYRYLLMKKKVLLFLLFISFIGLSNAQYNKLLNFNGSTTGSFPYGSFVSDGSYLFGMTQRGGANDMGALFKINLDGNGFVKLMDFNGSTTGSYPNGSLYYDGEFLYGMTQRGGANDMGTLFKIKPNGSGYTKLLDFAGTTNGSNPVGTLISDGIFLFGTTIWGGTNDKGTVFKIKTDGNEYKKLLDFTGYTNGFEPRGALIYDGTYLYGMTTLGGINFTSLYSGDGTIFKIKTDGTGYVKLLDFTNAVNGQYPYGSLVSDGSYLYGMTNQGGINNKGTVFKISIDGSRYTKLLDFKGAPNGCVPNGSLIYVENFLYGMTWGCGINDYGTIFRIKTDGSDYTKLWDFKNVIDGRNPYGTLFYDTNFFYGMTYSGGINNQGVIFKFGISTTGDNKEINKDQGIAVYPNPASDNFIIEAPQNATIEISNIEGKVIKTILNENIKTIIDLGSLSSGVYFIKVMTNKGITVKKLIKQ
jgi:uncharacterized repeat protein (TIGR03803 family)